MIAEGKSTPVVAGGGSLVPARVVLRDAATERAIEPPASDAGANSEFRRGDGALTALTTPLSVRNVTETQGSAGSDPIASDLLEAKNPISPDSPLTAPLDPGDVSRSKATSREGARARAIREAGEAQAKEDVTAKQAKAEGAALVEDQDEKGPDGLTEEERRKVEELKRRDAEVRAHEQAHSSAGGPYAGAPRFRFVRGPDGKFYAVAGEVSIDASAVPGNPQATIRKMQQVKRAALAPHQPSAQDRRVAAEAERKIIQARQEIREQEEEEGKKVQEKQAREEAEQRGETKTVSPKLDPVFDPEARFRNSAGGTGAAPGTGLVGPGDIDVDMSDTIDPRALFSLVA